MRALFIKELASFFSGITGYLIIGVFLTVVGLMMWVLPDYSLLYYPVATMQPLFSLAPVLFLFLLPAITMASLSEEHNKRTYEFLMSKPLTDIAIVLAKYFAVLAVVLLTLLPTIFYVYTIHTLGSPVGNIDMGQVAGSYIGLFLLAACFSSIGLFASSLTSNQIIAFILGLLLCFLMYWGFTYLSSLPFFGSGLELTIQRFGIALHYGAISKGLVDSRDVIYFLSVIVLFILFTLISMGSRTAAQR